MTTKDFEITFHGTAGPVIASAFEEYTITSQHGRTTICGPMRDQADLQGVLDRMFSLGLQVVDVHVGTSHEPVDRPGPSRPDR